jgi:hypothetical protein
MRSKTDCSVAQHDGSSVTGTQNQRTRSESYHERSAVILALWIPACNQRKTYPNGIFTKQGRPL